MKGYADLGSDIGNLIGAFLNKDAIQQKGYNDYAPKVAQARYYDAKTRESELDAEQKQRALNITPERIIQSLGVSPDIMARVQAGDVDQYSDVGPQIPVDPGSIDRVQRGNLAYDLATLAPGSNAQQLMNVLLGAQRMNAQDMTLSGQYDAGEMGRATAAAEGDALYNDGASGILNVFTGDVAPTARSQAGTAADAALAEQRRISNQNGGKDPSRIALAKFLESRGFTPEQALQISLMDVTPQELHAQIFRTQLQASMGSADSARKTADDYLHMFYGPNWKNIFAGGGQGAAPPPGIPEGWTVEAE